MRYLFLGCCLVLVGCQSAPKLHSYPPPVMVSPPPVVVPYQSGEPPRAYSAPPPSSATRKEEHTLQPSVPQTKPVRLNLTT
jgi:hypothetical protein